MDYTKECNMPAYILAVDFEKAFDSIDWGFMWKSLEVFDLPE